MNPPTDAFVIGHAANRPAAIPEFSGAWACDSPAAQGLRPDGKEWLALDLKFRMVDWPIRSSNHPVAGWADMSKQDLMTSIQRLNPTASLEFLEHFSEEELVAYLRQLQEVVRSTAQHDRAVLALAG